MDVQVNGEHRTLTAGVTVAGLLTELDIRPDRVAVEVNLNILDRSEFDGRRLQEGDRIEIISFIGGGGGSEVSRRPCARAPRTIGMWSVDARSVGTSTPRWERGREKSEQDTSVL